MTMTMTMPDRPSRWLLVGSLALNLFFIGTIASLAARTYVMPSQPAATERPLLRSVAARADATVLLPAAIGPLTTNSLLIQSAFRARRRGARHAGPAHAAPLPRRL